LHDFSQKIVRQKALSIQACAMHFLPEPLLLAALRDI
jgi:hypothetical protein